MKVELRRRLPFYKKVSQTNFQNSILFHSRPRCALTEDENEDGGRWTIFRVGLKGRENLIDVVRCSNGVEHGVGGSIAND